MKDLLAKLLYGIVVIEAVVGLGLGFMAYFVRSFDRATGIVFDGLGRQLELSPFLARFIFGAESLWPGWGYFALDFVVFWGGIAVGAALVNLASKLQTKQSA